METLDVGGWNIEWFGSVTGGPPDETLQRRNARNVILDADLDIWGLAEIVSAGDFEYLLSELPGYAGFLANDPIVALGSEHYTEGEQKVGILYRRGAVTVRSAQIILPAYEYEFGGRPPLEVELSVRTQESTFDLVLIVLHAKAMGDTRSYDRRRKAAASLKSYLDGARPADKVLVVGDFNDDVDTSITPGKPTP